MVADLGSFCTIPTPDWNGQDDVLQGMVFHMDLSVHVDRNLSSPVPLYEPGSLSAVVDLGSLCMAVDLGSFLWLGTWEVFV